MYVAVCVSVVMIWYGGAYGVLPEVKSLSNSTPLIVCDGVTDTNPRPNVSITDQFNTINVRGELC